MPPSRSHIRTTIEAYLARHPDERGALAGLLALLDGPAEPTSRSALPGHITCSAAVIDRDRHVLHIGHGPSNTLVAPGGRVGDDRTLPAAALRGVYEETGLRPGDLCMTPLFLGTPADIAVHGFETAPAEGEPAHQHYDFRFAFYLTEDTAPPLALRDAEAACAKWQALTDVSSPTLRAKLLDAEAQGLDGQPEPVNASALIHDGCGRYLLHLRDQREHIWEPWTLALLGGGREPGDSCLEETLRRELAEETPGLEPTGLTPYTVDTTTGVDGLVVPTRIYEGRWSGHPDSVDLREGVLLQWFTVDTLDRLRLSPNLDEMIRRHAAEHPAPDRPQGSGPRTRHGAPAGTELHIVGVHLYLQDEHGRILLGLRHPDAAFAGNTWHFLAGHCEREAAVSCLVREAQEEAGLLIDPADVELVHVVHVLGPSTGRPRIQLVFRARSWSGSPEVLEPDRCAEWRWWAPGALPHELVPYARTAIEGILAHRAYSELGWS
ncbi:NUDIX domain-containing protein [Streptomyces malaysiense]|uniref:NUDIX hydrolase n=1 Tax=Streptomyces malaysiense TaxID=1428626 RepID=A0A1J4Q8B8_9ACTN|nr:NUDIX domain-containing protein [Streptomyces malaysiense]OIK28367.1 NUDIX hydrolase [Streptomyces malaysiense]